MVTQVMVDIEALDSNAETAALVSLGAVKFDFDTGLLGDTFYAEVSLAGMKQQLARGRTMSLDTMIWWTQQSEDACKVFHPNDIKQDITQVLLEFSQFVGICPVWGNGVDYDNICLISLYKTFSMKCPLWYSRNRCFRTFKAVFGNRAKLEREGTHHNARDDAITQAKHLLAMYKAIT